MSDPLFFRTALARIDAFVPARSSASMQREFGLSRVLKLAGNENTAGPSPRVKAALLDTLGDLGQYPDPTASQLREKLAKMHALLPDQIVVENGLFALIPLIAQAFLNPNDQALIPHPSFAWYNIASLALDAQSVLIPLQDHKIDLNDISSKIKPKTKLIWLCNPNNPTGTFFSQTDLKTFLKSVPTHVVIVLDEAYGDFVLEKNYPNSVPLLAEYPNLIILKTFSKLYGLAGLRIGYGMMSQNIASHINKIRPPVNVNALAQIAAMVSLDDHDFQDFVLKRNEIGKIQYETFFDSSRIKYVKTHANFVLCYLGKNADLFLHHCLTKGVLLRSGKDFSMPEWIRITIGSQEENEIVLSLLKASHPYDFERC